VNDSLLALIAQASLLVKLILLVLAAFSVYSWAVILSKGSYFKLAAQQSTKFLSAFETAKNPQQLLEIAETLHASPLAQVFRQAFPKRHMAREELQRVFRRYEALAAERLHAKLTFLATTGSTAPFIGLLGTVIGIIEAFREIGAAGSASLDVVAPGIAEALIATAAGLAAAIPAVMAYNYYLSRARRMTVQMEDFSQSLVDLLESSRA
jgi:biopolymer transport protein TolQ